jgi:hypothetical protein
VEFLNKSSYWVTLLSSKYREPDAYNSISCLKSLILFSFSSTLDNVFCLWVPTLSRRSCWHRRHRGKGDPRTVRISCSSSVLNFKLYPCALKQYEQQHCGTLKRENNCKVSNLLWTLIAVFYRLPRVDKSKFSGLPIGRIHLAHAILLLYMRKLNTEKYPLQSTHVPLTV